ncbi:MAG: ATP-dependent helicase [Thauera propionica]|jgi:DNA helicase-2/ATP-dependent DNA helicase PcrA|nr:ATP-dependent helicase [Thauera sp.]MDI3489193.1 ATP-dependent helicase UvrD/PcrA [Thauera sp.]MDY0047375.1 ATP-dependent helicase [Thauera propionica]
MPTAHAPVDTAATTTAGAADPLAQLNPAQRAAVVQGVGDRAAPGAPLLVIAGAGSGKTNTLAHRVAHLIAHGADPGRILLLTFSRRAADEMGRRVRRILTQMSAGRPGLAQAGLHWSGTFHAIGARLLRDYAGRIGLDPGFTIHDREDAGDLMNLARHELGLSATKQRFPQKGTCLAIYSAAVNTQAPLAEVLQASFPWCTEWEDELKRLYRAYVEAKQAQQVLDYDDLLLYWAQMVADPVLGAEIGGLFDHVLVDEYQDTNQLQASILLAMKPDGRGLTVVGDDAQSIYAFRGATVRNILDFPAAFEPPAQVVTLEQNYRSTKPILEAANAVIALAAERFTKNLWSERESAQRPRLVSVKDDADQAAFVVDTVLARREEGLRLKQQAVLFRASAHSARLEMELTRRNIPFVKFGGLKFLEAAHVKDVLAVLRWAENPRDRISGFRAIQLLAGVGPKTAGRVLDNVCAAPEGCALLAEQPVPEAARAGWKEFAALVGRLAERPQWPADFELACRWYEAQMPRLYDDFAVRVLDVQQLARIAATSPSRQRFLTELTLDPPSATSGEAGMPLLDEDYLILSTMHSAKGQEWNAVSVLNVVDGCIPSDVATRNSAEVEEERRLLYVAMTRAKDSLDLIVPQRFYVTQQTGMGDRHVYAGRTRFIPNRLLGHFEQISWPPPPPELQGSPASRQAAIDLAAKMRDMWR